MRRIAVTVALLAAVPGLVRGQIVEPRRAYDRQSRLADQNRFCSVERAIRLAERAAIDVFDAGRLQTSFQLVRLCVGERGKFTVPVYFLIGADAAAGGSTATPSSLAANALNPQGGVFNLQIANSHEIVTVGQHTELTVAYTAGARYTRLPNSADPTTAQGFLAGDFDLGLRFQTGAFDLDDPTKAGLLWIQVKLASHRAPDSALAAVFGGKPKNLNAVSVEGAIDIEDRIGVRASWYHPVNNRSLEAFRKDVFKVGVELHGSNGKKGTR